MEETAKAARRNYMRQANKKWREENAEKVKAYQREWRSKNRDKVQEYEARYWMKKAQELAASKEVEQ